MDDSIDFSKIKTIHCLGVGGIGVSALAEILFKQGYRISGCDKVANKNFLRLEDLHLSVVLGHDPCHFEFFEPDAVMYSSAIAKDNEEYQTYVENGVLMLERGKVLALVMQQFADSIVVAGTHGKTSTSGMIAHGLSTLSMDPTYVLGGIFQTQDSPARSGNSAYFVAESDESDGSFLYMQPTVAVVTNIDQDHLETYGGDFKILQESFVKFMNQVQKCVVICNDDPILKSLKNQIKTPYVTYGFTQDSDWVIENFTQQGMCSSFQIVHHQERLNIRLKVPGKHSALNAVASLIAAESFGIPLPQWIEALKTYPGMKRRFELQGEMRVDGGTVTVIEDYGHHPNEIEATLSALRLAWPNRKLILAFQPHRYSRTRDLMGEFADVLAKADTLVLTDIYSAGEKPIENVNAKVLLQRIQTVSDIHTHYAPTIENVVEVLATVAKANDIVVLQGAGDIGKIAKTLVV